MPFLRAALLKNKAPQEPEQDLEPIQEPKVISAPVENPVEVADVTNEEPEEINIEQLHKVIDEKVKEIEEAESKPEDTEEIKEIEIIEPVEAPEEPEEPEIILEPEEPEDVEIISEETDSEPVTKDETSTEEDSESQKPSENTEDTTEDTPQGQEPAPPEDTKGTEIIPPVDAPVEIEDPDEFHLIYDVTSGERYVDKVSTKTEFDKMLDELEKISKDLLSWQVEKFARDYTVKFPGDGNKSEADAKKYEAFLGGYITNAAMILYDNNYKEAAIERLDKAKSILEARKKLEDETSAIKARVEEEEAIVDLSDIFSLFGDA